MKKAIEKAIANGFVIPTSDRSINRPGWLNSKLHSWWAGHEYLESTYNHYTKEGEFRFPVPEKLDYYHLIFGSGFIDKLVGEVKYLCAACQSTLDLNVSCLSDIACKECDSSIIIDSADYHRQQMANIKDIEKLKEYVRRLV